MEKNEKKEFVFYYESRQNPNGDPGFDNMPRKMPDETILVTDVRIKRTIRDYAKSLGKTIFVDYNKEGKHTTSDERAKEILGTSKLDTKASGLELLKKTFDVPLFGCLVTIRGKEDKESGDSIKITGPVQFSLGRSINKVNIINPMISSIFVGDEKKGNNPTFGKFYSVEYALIKIQGAINPENLGIYADDKEAFKAFEESERYFYEYLWKGTNNLVTRSKYPQRSVFYLEVTYKDSLYNDLGELIEENEKMKGYNIKEITKPLFKFGEPDNKLIKVLASRKDKISRVRILACQDVIDEATSLRDSLDKILPGKVELLNE